MLRTRKKDACICPWFKLFCVGCKGRIPNTGFRIHSIGEAEVKQEHVKGSKQEGRGQMTGKIICA